MSGATPADRAGLRVTVVICAFTERRWSQLERAVASLRAQTRAPDQVLVVIDHNEGLLARAHALDATVLRNGRAQGLSGARNTAVAVAIGDVVVFLDDDAYAEADWLERLVEPYEDPDIVAVGGYVCAVFDQGRPHFLPPEFDWVVGCSYRGQPVTRVDVRNVIGANMSFRRAVFERAGVFEESLGRIGDRPLGCEETEMCIRATRALPGGRVILEPSARVHHQVPAARGTWAYFRSRCYAEGLSKAAVSRFAGTERGLASERPYVTRTLPAGVFRGLSKSVRTGRREGVTQAGAIVLGLTVTTAGYVVGSVRLRKARMEPSARVPDQVAVGARSAAA